MVFGWRRKRNGGKNKHRIDTNMEPVIPHHFVCPISLDLMKDPVTLSSGITYDRDSIEAWLQDGNFTCPVTNQNLSNFDLIPNHSLRILIQDWCVENQNFGIQRIPTPRVPISSVQVSDLLSNLESSAKCLNKSQFVSLLQMIKKWASESERNRRSILANPSAAAVLGSAFHSFSTESLEENAYVLEEILSLMHWMDMFPLDKETQLYLGSTNSLSSMLWFLKCRDLSSKHSSILMLKEILSSDQHHAESLAAMEGVNQLLFKLIKDPVTPTITKASLMVIFLLLSSSNSSSEKIKSEYVDMGLVSLLIEMIIESERNTCERALGVLDELCDCEKGREEAYNNALTWPVLVKKILRVSHLATEYSVSSIWKLIKHGRSMEKIMAEVLQVGAFQKLVLLLQVGCVNDTKEKTTELLKLMNPYRNGFECIDSLDFKNLKRSF